MFSRRLIIKVFKRTITTREQDAINEARLWLSRLDPSKLPHDRFAVSFSRSSGPGGQNVNKVSSKATIKLTNDQWKNADWVPVAAKEQLFADLSSFPYTTKTGSLVIQSDKSRNRQENLQDCYDKLVTGIKNHVYFANEANEEDIKRWEQIHKRAERARLENKKQKSEKKQTRKISKRDMEI